MNINKRLKPNLLDPIIQKKIIKTLKPPKEDYWAPTKSTFQNFYQNYIKPNYGLIIFIIIILLLLVYRYKLIRDDRENKQFNKNIIVEKPKENPLQYNNNQIPQENLEEYTNTLINIYNQQKELLREPRVKYYKNIQPIPKYGPGLAYPMYPYTKGGSLIPSGSR